MPDNPNQPSKRMAELLLERERLEQTIKESFSKEVSILFSDICGYTQYTEAKGDIQARAMLLRHNQIVLPAVKDHSGKVIEVIGDAVMAAFETPVQAVEAAVDIQRRLSAANAKGPVDSEIHVKIGINMGQALIDEHAAFQGLTGDVANVAARIQNFAERDEILISRTVYEKTKEEIDCYCRLHDTVAFKGKAKSMPVYRVLWKHDTPVWVSCADADTADGHVPRIKVKPAGTVVTLEFNRDGTNLNISFHEKRLGEESTLRHYETIAFDASTVDARCKALVENLNKANRRGQVSGQTLAQLREIGNVLYDELLSLDVKERLYQTTGDMLILSIDDQLVHIPWELLYDGQQFLCMRFSMGRLVKTRQMTSSFSNRSLSAPLDMLVLADPTGDLKSAYDEGTQIRDFLDQNTALINATLHTDHISAETLKAKLRNYDLIHYAGHADYNTRNPTAAGWRLRDSNLTTEDIMRMAGSAKMPTMVFANACQSARTEQWVLDKSFEHQIFGVANAFLLAGVKHYVGTFWEIPDEPGSHFAIEFYKHLFSGENVGQAVLKARRALIDLYGEETIIWASYVFYGDPTFNYAERIEINPMPRETTASTAAKPASLNRTREEIVDFSQARKGRSLPSWMLAAAAVILLAAIGLWGVSRYRVRGAEAMEQQAYAHYHAGDYEKASQLCRRLLREASKRPLSALLLGNIHLSRGELVEARRFFDMAVAKSPDARETRSEALMGLGRLASIASREAEALDYYHQAVGLDPDNVRAVTSQAVLLERQGKFEDAFQAYRLASSLAPDDAGLQAAADQVKDRLAIIQDKARQARIDQLIDDILATERTAPLDRWTSRPLTLWLIDFQTTGFSPQEGAGRLVHGLLERHMLDNDRLQLVERALLEKLLAELKIGSSRLADPATALTVGRLAAARVMVVGRLIFLQGQLRAVVRMIDCETGLVSGSIMAHFDPADPVDTIAETIAARVINQLKQEYPIRAKVTSIRNGNARIDAGHNVGIFPGMLFRGLQGHVILRVQGVDGDYSEAEVIAGGAELRPDLRVEEQPPEKS